ncbi:glycoside hydrolase family 19 protein [Pseudoxanthomonas winnipegensis]|uniref:Glycoside hydrolase family 19 protein n=1 Tax=Pseudoxanthomonas winnipegensis TaxID=2480810 RepID=A0A4Q8LCH2_9GAMM|nr:glycoside hydrolase family 19 protein [Pseudoxanthomonas winnipegensis]
MIITDDTLARVMQVPVARVQRWTPHVNASMDEFGISTVKRAAGFLAEVGHESLSLSRTEESLVYSTAERIVTVFRRFDLNGDRKIDQAELDFAKRFIRQPEALANFAYANRGGNGDRASGDGWRYRGRGPMQITLRNGYARAGARLGLDLVSDPDLLLDPAHGMRAAGAFWKDNGLNAWADAGDVLAMSRGVNLGDPRSKKTPEGMEDRRTRFRRALDILGGQ